MKLKIILTYSFILIAFPAIAQENAFKWKLNPGVVYEYKVSETEQTKIENADEKLLGEYAGIKETETKNEGRLRIFGKEDRQDNFLMELKEVYSSINGLPLEKKKSDHYDITMRCSIDEEGSIESKRFKNDGMRTVLFFPLPPEPFGEKIKIEKEKSISFDNVSFKGKIEYIKQNEDAEFLHYEVYFSVYNNGNGLRANMSGKEECIFSKVKGYFTFCDGSFEFSSMITPPSQVIPVYLHSKNSFTAKIQE